ncbi:MAG: hydrogenase nickel incorporation protein HypB [Candidatus Thermoplasmatota archaeon]
MHDLVIDMSKDVLLENRTLAKENSKKMKKFGTEAYEFMGSIGSGKTLIIERIIENLKEKGIKCGVIAGDVAGEDDYKRFKKHGIEVVNVNTGKECHLDAHLISHALNKLNLKNIDILFIENVGNLVCPVDFPLGAKKRIVVISLTEGDDMVRKHPIIFAIANVIIINKIDLARVVDVDPNIIIKDIKKIEKNKKIYLTDAKHEYGIDKLMVGIGL